MKPSNYPKRLHQALQGRQQLQLFIELKSQSREHKVLTDLQNFLEQQHNTKQ